MRRPRILITRTRHQASALAAKLEARGAETIVIPTIELAPPSSFNALDEALDALSRPGDLFDWLIFTSANAVQAFCDRAQERGIAVAPKRIAVVGPATLRAVTDAGLGQQSGPILMPESYVAEALAASLLAASGPSPRQFLIVRAQEARDVVPTALEAAGHRITMAPAYRNITPPGTIAALQALFASPQSCPDIITFTSSSTVSNLFALLKTSGIKLPSGIQLASIGAITSATLRELGHQPDIEAAEPTIDSLVAAIATFAADLGAPSSPQSYRG